LGLGFDLPGLLGLTGCGGRMGTLGRGRVQVRTTFGWLALSMGDPNGCSHPVLFYVKARAAAGAVVPRRSAGFDRTAASRRWMLHEARAGRGVRRGFLSGGRCKPPAGQGAPQAEAARRLGHAAGPPRGFPLAGRWKPPVGHGAPVDAARRRARRKILQLGHPVLIYWSPELTG